MWYSLIGANDWQCKIKQHFTKLLILLHNPKMYAAGTPLQDQNRIKIVSVTNSLTTYLFRDYDSALTEIILILVVNNRFGLSHLMCMWGCIVKNIVNSIFREILVYPNFKTSHHSASLYTLSSLNSRDEQFPGVFPFSAWYSLWQVQWDQTGATGGGNWSRQWSGEK